MKTLIDAYRKIPANSIRAIDGGLLIKGDNALIHTTPNLKREIMSEMGSSTQIGLTFYESSSLAEFNYNGMKVPFNVKDYPFLNDSKEQIKNTKNKKKVIKNQNKIAKNDRFKHILEKLKKPDLNFAPFYMHFQMLCKTELEVYKKYFKKDFFKNTEIKEFKK